MAVLTEAKWQCTWEDWLEFVEVILLVNPEEHMEWDVWLRIVGKKSTLLIPELIVTFVSGVFASLFFFWVQILVFICLEDFYF